MTCRQCGRPISWCAEKKLCATCRAIEDLKKAGYKRREIVSVLRLLEDGLSDRERLRLIYAAT